MSNYQALARQWRPKTFSQLLGQEQITRSLSNALKQKRLHHAYLFTGEPGIGKTSLARILAKGLNCEQGISAEPCLLCEICLSIEHGRLFDLIEIDAASKTRVEDTRELLDNIPYAPTSARFKVYLIDEVHMLSQHSFNALLKTLEEPPEHVKFILATSDPQKLPVTILSRCLQFHLKPIAAELISQHLQAILQNERIDFERPAVDLLAQAARGNMRDALSLLDQSITSHDGCLRASHIKSILGYTQQDYALQLLQALALHDLSHFSTINQNIAEEGGHFHYVFDEMLHALHQIAVFQHLKGPAATIPEIQQLAQQLTQEEVQLFYQIAMKGREELHLAPTLAIGFSMTLLRMFTFKPSPIPILETIPQHEPTVMKQELPLTPSEPELEDWSKLITKLKLHGPLQNAIENTELVEKDQNQMVLRIAKGHLSLFTQSTITGIERALTDYFQSAIKISLIHADIHCASPAKQKEAYQEKKHQTAQQNLENDPLFRDVQREFSAELLKNSILLLEDDI